jgi:hypothetical protein
LEEVVQEYVKKLKTSKTIKKQHLNEEGASDEEDDQSEPKNEVSNENDDLYYYSKVEKKFKVFDPRTKTWSAHDNQPSTDVIA